MSLEKIKELFHADKNGTNAYDMVEGMRHVGFSAKGVHCSFEKLTEGELLLPCIAHVTLNQSYSHFVVIYEMNPRKGELLVADPANKILKIKFDLFKTIYSETLILLYPLKPLLQFSEEKIKWTSLKQFLSPNKKILWQIFFFSIFILLYAIGTSFYGEIMLKQLQVDQEESFFLFLFLLFAGFTFLKLTGEFFRNRLFLWLEKKMDLLLSLDTFHKVLSLSYHYYHNHSTGDILSRIQSLEDVKVAISKWIIVLIIDIPLMLISFFCLYLLQSEISILLMLFFFLELFLLKLFERPLDEKIRECQLEASSLMNTEVECLRSFETIKGISLESYHQEKWATQKVSFLNGFHRLKNLLSLENYSKQLCEEFSTLLLLLVGCLFVKKGELTFGSLLTIQNLSSYFFMPVRELIDLDKDTKQAKKTLERISVFDREKSQKGFLPKLSNGTIVFDNLSYSYRPEKEVLHAITLSIAFGEKVLVLGSSGSGKSTLFKLLKGYYDVPRGMIRINDYDINDYKNLGEICYIHQNESLYTGSLMENITLSSKWEEKQLKEITNICEVEEIAQKENLGYLQLIEENGVNLSGGERQRVILARTLLRPFQILIVDEGLNQLDVSLERKILKQIFQKYSDKTIVVISHREANLDLFDRKIRIEKGFLRENVKRKNERTNISTTL